MVSTLRRRVAACTFALAAGLLVGMPTAGYLRNLPLFHVLWWLWFPLVIWTSWQARAAAIDGSENWKWRAVLCVTDKRTKNARRALVLSLLLWPTSTLLMFLLDRQVTRPWLELYLASSLSPITLLTVFHWAFRPQNLFTPRALYLLFHPAAALGWMRVAAAQREQEQLPEEWLSEAIQYFRLIVHDGGPESLWISGKPGDLNVGSYGDLRHELFDVLDLNRCVGCFTMEPALKTALSQFSRAVREIDEMATRRPGFLEPAHLLASPQWRYARDAAASVLRTQSAKRYM